MMNNKSPEIMEASPVLPPLMQQMRACLVANKDGYAMVAHDKPLSEVVKWAEYDVKARRVVLVMLSGRMQDLGIVVGDDMEACLRNTPRLSLVFMKGDQVGDLGLVPLIVQDGLYN